MQHVPTHEEVLPLVEAALDAWDGAGHACERYDCDCPAPNACPNCRALPSIPLVDCPGCCGISLEENDARDGWRVVINGEDHVAQDDPDDRVGAHHIIDPQCDDTDTVTDEFLETVTGELVNHVIEDMAYLYLDIRP